MFDKHSVPITSICVVYLHMQPIYETRGMRLLAPITLINHQPSRALSHARMMLHCMHGMLVYAHDISTIQPATVSVSNALHPRFDQHRCSQWHPYRPSIRAHHYMDECCTFSSLLSALHRLLVVLQPPYPIIAYASLDHEWGTRPRNVHHTGTYPLHAVPQSEGQSSNQGNENDALLDDDDDDVDEDEEGINEGDVEFPEPGQDEDQWTDDEQLLVHGPMVNTGKAAWYANACVYACRSVVVCS